MLNGALIGTKALWQSKTFWGGLLAVGSGVSGLFGFGISPADAANLSGLLADGAATVGGIVAIVGRIRASARIR